MIDPAVLNPATPDERISGGFAWYCRRLFRKRFHAILTERGGVEQLQALDAFDGPSIVVLNHAAWWDPLIGYMLDRDRLPERTSRAPIEMEQLQQFKIFKKLGLFGIEPDHPDALGAMTEYIAGLFAKTKGTLILTPQGQFTDPRERIRLRPGAAALLAAFPTARLVSVAIEYIFWLDQKPELLTRVATLDVPAVELDGRTTACHRAITRLMQDNQNALATLSKARDEAPFEPLFDWSGAGAAKINPFYDLVLRLRGKSGKVTQAERAGTA
ncbi:MAG: lysophospholipid acyltransferase family protein [Planctomycetota bacterium]